MGINPTRHLIVLTAKSAIKGTTDQLETNLVRQLRANVARVASSRKRALMPRGQGVPKPYRKKATSPMKLCALSVLSTYRNKPEAPDNQPDAQSTAPIPTKGQDLLSQYNDGQNRHPR